MNRKSYTKLLCVLLMLLAGNIMPNRASAQTYCVPIFINGCNGFNPWHNNSITLNTLSWTVGTCTTYDYTSMSTTLNAGVPYPMSVSSGVYTGCTVWVDLNNNGSFEDPGECLFYNYTAGPGGYETYNFNLTIPPCTPTGSYRMRVLAGWGTDGYDVSTNGYGSCGTISYMYGNFDDFTLNVVQAPCAAPAPLTASSSTGSTATFTWTATCSATCQYILNTTPATPTTAGTPITATTYNATGLTAGTTYYFHIRNMCSDGDSSAWVYVPVTPQPCDPPISLTTSGITTTTGTINWSAAGGGAAPGTFQYVFGTSGSSPTAPGTTLPLTTTAYSGTGLAPGTTYYFFIRTMCADGDSSAWVETSFTTDPPCNPPVSLAAGGVTWNSATLTWMTPSGDPVTDYQYVLNMTPGAPTGAGTPITGLSYNATGLTPVTTYYYHIRTMCTDGDSSAWVTVSFTTHPACDTPTILTNSLTYQGIHISWTSVPNAVQYQYVLNNNPAPPTVAGTSTTDTEYNMIALIPLTTYFFHLQTVCTGGSSAWATITFTTTKNTTGVINVNNENNLDIQVNPNPAKDLVTVTIDGEPSGNAYLQLTDMAGRTLFTTQVSSKKVIMNLADLPQGMYFVHYTDDVNKQTVKLVK